MCPGGTVMRRSELDRPKVMGSRGKTVGPRELGLGPGTLEN